MTAGDVVAAAALSAQLVAPSARAGVTIAHVTLTFVGVGVSSTFCAALVAHMAMHPSSSLYRVVAAARLTARSADHLVPCWYMMGMSAGTFAACGVPPRLGVAAGVIVGGLLYVRMGGG